MLELFDYRCLVEGMIARAAAERRTPGDVSRLRAALADFRAVEEMIDGACGRPPAARPRHGGGTQPAPDVDRLAPDGRRHARASGRSPTHRSSWRRRGPSTRSWWSTSPPATPTRRAGAPRGTSRSPSSRCARACARPGTLVPADDPVRRPQPGRAGAAVDSRTTSSGWNTTWRCAGASPDKTLVSICGGRRAHRVVRPPDGGERDGQLTSEGDVVVADEGDVLRHPDPVLQQGLQHPEGQQVDRGRHRGGPPVRWHGGERLAPGAAGLDGQLGRQ